MEHIHLPHVFLASKSPRRRQLLEDCGITFDLIDGEIDESLYPTELPLSGIAEYLASQKAAKALTNINDGIVLAADSVVICNEQLLGKPIDKKDAVRILRLLSDKRHDVITGVCIQDHETRVSFSETSYVTFEVLTDAEIEYYIEHFQPYDKAGAYAIQEWIGKCRISRIEGSYTNIMGLPTERVYRILKDWYPD